MTDIIMPMIEDKPSIKCLQSIRQNTADYRIVWVNGNNSKDARKSIMEEALNHSSRLTVWPSSRIGFIKSLNLGLKLALEINDIGSEYVVIQNNNTIVTDKWLKKIIECMDKDSKIMAAGPTTATKNLWQGWKRDIFRMTDTKEIPHMELLSDDQIERALTTQFKDNYWEVPMISSFCMVLRRKIFEEIGYIKEDCEIGSEDSDLCARIINKGYKCVFVPSSYVVH